MTADFYFYLLKIEIFTIKFLKVFTNFSLITVVLQ